MIIVAEFLTMVDSAVALGREATRKAVEAAVDHPVAS